MQDPKLIQAQVQGIDEEVNAATVGLLGSGLTKDAVLGIIKDEEDSCQDSDFSGDDEKRPAPDKNDSAPQQDGKKGAEGGGKKTKGAKKNQQDQPTRK